MPEMRRNGFTEDIESVALYYLFSLIYLRRRWRRRGSPGRRASLSGRRRRRRGR